MKKAEEELRTSDDAYITKTAATSQAAQAFEKQQADIDKRLMIVTQSETSGDAAKKFAASMERLKRLDTANAYIEMLAEVDAVM